MVYQIQEVWDAQGLAGNGRICNLWYGCLSGDGRNGRFVTCRCAGVDETAVFAARGMGVLRE